MHKFTKWKKLASTFTIWILVVSISLGSVYALTNAVNEGFTLGASGTIGDSFTLGLTGESGTYEKDTLNLKVGESATLFVGIDESLGATVGQLNIDVKDSSIVKVDKIGYELQVTAEKIGETYVILKLPNNITYTFKVIVSSDVDKTALTTAIAEANDAKTGVKTSIDGKDVIKGTFWVVASVLQDLNDAIEIAQEVIDDINVTQDEVDDAITTLNTAIVTFNNEKVDGTKTPVNHVLKIETNDDGNSGITIDISKFNLKPQKKYDISMRIYSENNNFDLIIQTVNTYQELSSKDFRDSDINSWIDLSFELDLTNSKYLKDGNINFTNIQFVKKGWTDNKNKEVTYYIDDFKVTDESDKAMYYEDFENGTYDFKETYAKAKLSIVKDPVTPEEPIQPTINHVLKVETNDEPNSGILTNVSKWGLEPQKKYNVSMKFYSENNDFDLFVQTRQGYNNLLFKGFRDSEANKWVDVSFDLDLTKPEYLTDGKINFTEIQFVKQGWTDNKNKEVTYYIDEFKVTEVQGSESSEIYSEDFENGMPDFIKSYTNSTISIVEDPETPEEPIGPDGDMVAKVITGEAQWSATEIQYGSGAGQLNLEANKQYRFSMDVYTPNIEIPIVLQTVDTWAGMIIEESFDDPRTPNWTKLEGYLDLSRNDLVDENGNFLFERLQITKAAGHDNTNKIITFYINNFVVTDVTDPDNTVIVFEENFDSGKQNILRNGTGTVSVVKNPADIETEKGLFPIFFDDEEVLDVIEARDEATFEIKETILRKNNEGKALYVSGKGIQIDVSDEYEEFTEHQVNAWIKTDNPSAAEYSLYLEIGSGETVEIGEIDTKKINGEWVRLSGKYRLYDDGEVKLIIECNDENVDYYIDYIDFYPIPGTLNKFNDKLKPLKDIYKDYWLFGTIVNPSDFNANNSIRYDLIKHHFNTVSFENNMKPGYFGMNSSSDNPNFVDLDKWVKQLQSDGFAIHGHVLAWHAQSPAWLNQGDAANYLTAKSNLELFIEKVAGHYYQNNDLGSNPLYSWDVFNEVINYWGSDSSATNDTSWQKEAVGATGTASERYWWIAYNKGAEENDALASDYVYDAFVAARKADPDTTLYYNDYNMQNAGKATLVMNMVNDINKRYAEEYPEANGRLLIEGIGMQEHQSIKTNIDEVEASIKKFISTGCVISISELDISIGDNVKWDEAKELEQAIYTAKLFHMLKKYKDNIERVTFWGLDDDHSWINSSTTGDKHALIFNGDLSAKLMYYAIADPEGFLEEQGIKINDNVEVIEKPDNSNLGTRPTVIATKGSPESIDDAIWNDVSEISIDRHQDRADGATGTAKVMFDDVNLYVRAEVEAKYLVSTGNAHEQTSVEVFVDQIGHKKGDWHKVEGVGQYRANYLGAKSKTGDWFEDKDFDASAKTTSNGYIVEFKIPLNKVEYKDGEAIIGFDIQINDASEKGGARRDVVIWNDITFNGYSTTVNLGSVMLTNNKITENNAYIIIQSSVGGNIVTGENGWCEVGDKIKLEAVPESGYIFVGWYEDSKFVTNEINYTYTVSKTTALEARFKPTEYTINLVAGDGGRASGSGVFKPGATVTARATPKTGYTFDGWYKNNEFVSAKKLYLFEAKEDSSLEARFFNYAGIDTAINFAKSAKTGIVTSVDGTDVLRGTYWVTEDVMKALDDAIVTAQKVINDNTATSIFDINNAITTLNTAVSIFNAAKKEGTKEAPVITIDKTTLVKAIADATIAKAGVKTSTNGKDIDKGTYWVTAGIITTFNTAITTADIINKNTAATQTEVDDAVTVLSNAIKVFNDAKKDGTKEAPVITIDKTTLVKAIADATIAKAGVKTSTDGKDIDKGTYWVTAGIITTFNTAITTADIINKNTAATQTEVDDAVTVLSNAIKVFNDAKKDGTKEAPVVIVNKTALEKTIIDANVAKTEVKTSTDGKDVDKGTYWVTAGVMTTFNTAITSAQAVIDNKDATQAQVDTAVTTLNNAINVFNDAKKDGIKKSSDNSLSDLELNKGTLIPAFTSDNTSYSLSVSNNTSSITIKPTATDEKASITVNGVETNSGSSSGAVKLNVGKNTITVAVTAEDGTVKNYIIIATRSSASSGGNSNSGNNNNNNNNSNNSNDSNGDSNDSTENDLPAVTKPANASDNVSEDGTVSSENIKEELNKALDEIKDKNNDNATLRTKNASSIANETIKELAEAAKSSGKKVILHADSMSADGKSVQGRLYVDPELLIDLKEDLKLGITTDKDKTEETVKFFEKWFDNKVEVVKFEQQGGFGAKLKVAAKVDLTQLDTKNLIFYSYDKETNKYVKLKNTDYRIDKNGYVHFYTKRAGDIIITDKPLSKK